MGSVSRAVVPRHDEAARQTGDERVDHPSDAALKHIGERDRVPVRPQARYAYSGAALVALMLLLADHRIDLDVLHAQLAIMAEQRPEIGRASGRERVCQSG